MESQKPVAALAALHHERLDGSGYHRGATAATLSTPARILSAADAYRTKLEPRPHRTALSPSGAAEWLQGEARGGRLDPDAVAAILSVAGHEVTPEPREWPGGLSRREVEVLTLLASGLTMKQIAQRLVISKKTVDHHIQHIYSKIGISTRAAAALFAMQNGLLRAPLSFPQE